MNDKQPRFQTTTMENLAHKALLSKYLIWPISIATAMVAIIVFYFAGTKDMVVFPNPQYARCDGYNDSANNGNTQVTHFSVTDSSVAISFALGNAFHSPYAGLSFASNNDNTFNAKKHNRLSIAIKGHQLDKVGISIFTRWPYGESNKQEEALYHMYLNLSDNKETYDLPLDQFKHPEWWEDVHGIGKDQQQAPDLGQILHVNIGSAYSSDTVKQKKIEVYSIAFTRNNSTLFAWLGAVYLLFVALMLGARVVAMRWRNGSAEITVSYKALDVDSHIFHEDKCIEYINTNYQDAELTLDKISVSTGTMPRRISQTINELFNCNFKTYLNRIRLTESQRLLAKTDLNVGEIAFTVGFNNQSHFNRVFKAEFGISPTEYREQHKS